MPLDQDAGDAGHRHAREARADQPPCRAVAAPAPAPAGSRECRRSRSPRQAGAAPRRPAAARGRRAARRRAWSASRRRVRSRPGPAAATTGARVPRANEREPDQRRGRRLDHARRWRNWRPACRAPTGRPCRSARRPAARPWRPRTAPAPSALQAAIRDAASHDRARPAPSRAPQRAREQGQEQHAAQRHRLRDDGQPMQDDDEIAEQVDQQATRSGPGDGEGHVAAGDVAVDCQHLPAHHVGARRQRRRWPRGCRAGRPGAIGSTDWLWSGAVASGASGRDRSGCCSGTPSPPSGRHAVPPRGRLALHQDGVRLASDGRAAAGRPRGEQADGARCVSGTEAVGISAAPVLSERAAVGYQSSGTRESPPPQLITDIRHEPPTPPGTRADYRCFHAITTRWMDNDVFRHVNNVNYFSYFDTAVTYFEMTQRVVDLLDGPVHCVVAEVHCRYHSSVAFPDRITVGLRVARIGGSSVRYEIARVPQRRGDRGGRGLFRARLRRSRRRSGRVPIPEAMREMTATDRRLTEGETEHGPGHSRPQGDRLRGEQGAGPGLRDVAGARGRRCGHHRPHRARRWRRPPRRSARETGAKVTAGCRRHRHRGGPRRGARRLPEPRHPGQQRRRPAARRFPRMGPRRLAEGGQRQHADADHADQGGGRRHVRAQIRPHRQHHLGLGEVADPQARHEQRRARRPDRLRRRPRAPGGAAQRHDQQPAARPVPDRPAALRHRIEAARAATARSRRCVAERGEGPTRPAASATRPSSATPAPSCAPPRSGFIVGQNLLLDGGAFNSSMG